MRCALYFILGSGCKQIESNESSLANDSQSPFNCSYSMNGRED